MEELANTNIESNGDFLKLFGPIIKEAEKMKEKDNGADDIDDGTFPVDLMGMQPWTWPRDYEIYTPMRDASEKTLRFKVQLKGVTKSAVWRDVEISAACNFDDLSTVIQCVMG